jgi:hypothetical protein
MVASYRKLSRLHCAGVRRQRRHVQVCASSRNEVKVATTLAQALKCVYGHLQSPTSQTLAVTMRPLLQVSLADKHTGSYPESPRRQR